MHFLPLKQAGPLLLALAAVALPITSAVAGNLNYNFNQGNNDQGWVGSTGTTQYPIWALNLGPSVTGGGFQAFTGTNTANFQAYLTSPCLVVSATSQKEAYVNFDLSHGFNFPVGSGTIPDHLGQIQFQYVSSITGSLSGWIGIPASEFVKANGNPAPGNVVPNYGPPLYSGMPISGTTGQAFTGTQPTGFGTTSQHVNSEFTLFWSHHPGFVNGSEFQIRFLMATNPDLAGTPIPTAMNWEVNGLTINNASECVVPEPGTIALAATGFVAGLGWYARRRFRVRRPRGVAIAGLLVGLALIATACQPGRASADVVNTFDFTVNSGTWTPSQAFPAYPASPWTYVAGTKWSVASNGVGDPSASTGAYLTSPLITFTGTTPVTSLRLSMSHNYSLPNGQAYPNAAGQVAYRLNGSGAWLGLPLSAFTTGTGSINDPNAVFGPSPLVSPGRVSQTAFVPPTYVPPNGSGYSSLDPLINGGVTFTGKTPSWSGDVATTTFYVPSQAFISSTSAITSIELRLIQANLGSGCSLADGWNVKFIELDAPSTEPPVPEPATLVLAATGGAWALTRWLMRRSKKRM